MVVFPFHSRCPHCENMKKDWEMLMEEFKDSNDELVAEIDCTSEGGRSLCQAHGIDRYPTLKWGDPLNLNDYTGSRNFNSLKIFADEHLKPMCSPSNIDLCDEEMKAKITKFIGMADNDLETLIQQKEDEMKEIEKVFKTFVEGLQDQFQNAVKKRQDTMDTIKGSGGLGLMKAVMVAKKKKLEDSDESGVEENCTSCNVIME
jgi:hypothetical protein